MNEYVLIGYRVYKNKETNEIKGYSLFFSQLQKNNSVNDFGTIVKSLYAFPNQLNCGLEIGALYYVFTAYDSGLKTDKFAGLMLINGEKK